MVSMLDVDPAPVPRLVGVFELSIVAAVLALPPEALVSLA